MAQFKVLSVSEMPIWCWKSSRSFKSWTIAMVDVTRLYLNSWQNLAVMFMQWSFCRSENMQVKDWCRFIPRLEKASEATQCVSELDSLQGSHFMKQWRRSLSLNENPRMLEMPGLWHIHQEKLQTQREASWRGLHILQAGELERWGCRWGLHRLQMLGIMHASVVSQPGFRSNFGQGFPWIFPECGWHHFVG